MSSPEHDEHDSAGPAAAQMIDDPDDDTLRIMVSTDNHLGYNERDPVRGMDSFAAFEEVLYLAKRFHCDMVLIAGDLFHHNKPSRPTLYKAMEIIRRYCMGDNPVRIQILSDQAKNFDTGVVNYQDPNYSVDLPIFSIHGNHDDPVRDGAGKTALAALDLLSISNLVNYIGKQDKVDQVEISPVLLQKGSTKVALFGLGSMRDERLNRMWNGRKVRFLRPSEDVNEGEDEDEEGFFNIFTLHQNRDLGRGSKNCIQESMIPEWMDLVVWGHEHECLIEIFESVVGTFRITQPGSSVATSLVAGEAARKKVGILDIKGQQFRLKTIPLTQVRSFVTTELSLREHREELDPDDPRVEEHVGEVLEEEVRVMVLNARERRQEVLEEALAAGSDAGTDDSPLSYKMEKPHEVLVRVRVEHSGFTTLNNQRFGAKFVGDVANPEDILLFHRKKDPSATASKSRSSKRNMEPIPPEQLEGTNMQDLAHDILQDDPDSKLMLLSEKKLRESVEDYVDRGMVSSIDDAADGMLNKRQKMLFTGANVASTGKQDKDENDLDDESSQRETEKARRQKRKVDQLEDSVDEKGRTGKENSSMNLDDLDDDDDDFATAASSTKRRNAQGTTERRSRDDSEAESDTPQPTQGRNAKAASSTKRGARAAQGDSKRKAARREKLISLYSDDDIEVVETSTKARPKRASRGKAVKYTDDMDDSDDYQPDAVDDDDDDIVEVVEQPKRKNGRKQSSARTARKNTSVTGGKSRRTARAAMPKFDDSDEDMHADTADLDDDWGTANTRSQI